MDALLDKKYLHIGKHGLNNWEALSRPQSLGFLWPAVRRLLGALVEENDVNDLPKASVSPDLWPGTKGNADSGNEIAL